MERKQTCSNCKTEHDVKQNFCGNCGNKLKEPPPTAPKRTPSKKDKDPPRPPPKVPRPPPNKPDKEKSTEKKTNSNAPTSRNKGPPPVPPGKKKPRPISENVGPVSDLKPPLERTRSGSLVDETTPLSPQINTVNQRLTELNEVTEEESIGSRPPPPPRDRSPGIGTDTPDIPSPQKPRAPSLPDRDPPLPPLTQTPQDRKSLDHITEKEQDSVRQSHLLPPRNNLGRPTPKAKVKPPPLPPPKKVSTEKAPNSADFPAQPIQDTALNSEKCDSIAKPPTTPKRTPSRGQYDTSRSPLVPPPNKYSRSPSPTPAAFSYDTNDGDDGDTTDSVESTHIGHSKKPGPATPRRTSSLRSDPYFGSEDHNEEHQDDFVSVIDYDPEVDIEDPLLIGYRNEVMEHRKQSLLDNDGEGRLSAPIIGGLRKPSIPNLLSPNDRGAGMNGNPHISRLLTRKQASVYKRRPVMRKMKSIDRTNEIICSRCLLSIESDEVHVHFVTILNPDFSFNEDSDKMFVRMGGAEFGSMHENTLEMRQSRILKDKYILFEGSKVFQTDQVLDKMLPYMYLVEKGDSEPQWESIANIKDGKDVGWNRCLQIHSAKYNGNGVWTQFDWPVQLSGDKKDRSKRDSKLIKRHSSVGKKQNQERQIAVETYLPNWEGFRQTDLRKEVVFGQYNAETMEVSKALDNVEQVWSCLAECQLKDITSGAMTSWDTPGFDLQKAVMRFLASKINSYKSKATPDINNDQLHSALAICYLVDQHALPISDTEFNNLWDGLFFTPCSEDITVTVLQSLRRQFGPYLKFAIKSLESQCRISIQKSWKTGDHRWLLAVPLLHFLRGDTRPYAPVEIDPGADYNDPNHWGLSGLNANKGWVHRADTGSLSQLHKRIDMICHSVEQDRLLPYVILWLLLTSRDQRRILVDYHEHLPKRYKAHPYLMLHALDVAMLKLTVPYEPKSPSKQSSSNWDVKYLMSDVGLLCNAMVSFLKANRFISTSIGEKFINMAVSVAQSSMILTTFKQQELITRSFTLINLCIASLWQGPPADDIYSKIRLPVKELVVWLRQNLPTKFWDYNVKDKKPPPPLELEIWKELFKMTFPRAFEEVWKSNLLDLFKERLYTTITDAARVRIAQIRTGRPELDHVIHQAAVESMEVMLKNERKNEIRTSQYEQVGDLMTELLKTSALPKSRDQTEEEKWLSLQQILEWKPIVTLINLSGAESTSKFDSEASLGLSLVIKLVEEMCEKLVDGSIQLRQLYAIVGDSDKLQRFLEIYKTSSVNKQYSVSANDGGNAKISKVNASNMEALLKIRQKEFQSIEEKQPLTENFVQLCQALAPGIQVETTQLVHRAVFDVKTSENTLMQHCTTFTHRRKSITSSNDVSKYQPVVKIVVPAAVMTVLQPLYNCHKKDSRIFRAICKHQIDFVTLKLEQRVCSSVYAAREIWQQAINKWEKIKDGLIDASITIEDVKTYFAGLDGSEVTMREELCKLSDNEEREPKWLAERVVQIQELFQAESSIEFSQILMDLIDILGLADTRISELGNWAELATSGSRSLKSATTANKLSRVANMLSMAGAAQIESIKQVVQSESVVRWIRNNVEDVNEFFEFIEEIQSTELETDAQFDALSAFGRAVNGYAPLIFDLKKTASIDDVIKACHIVWTNLQYDRNMASVLRDSQKYLPMLQQFREDKSYAQTTAMQEVEAINARGTYTIGTQPGEGNDYYSEPNQDLFQLLVSKDINNPDSRATTYKLEDLQELEKSLTLMSSNVTAKPEKQGQLDYFTEVLAMVQQTAAVYKILCSSGCMFFREWGAKLQCFHYHSKPSMVAHFGTGKAISGSREITKELLDLRLFMDECTHEWLNYVEGIRSEYYYLNYFTNDQLLLLRQNLAQRSILGDLPHTFTLLSKVKAGCKIEHLDEALAICDSSAARNEPTTAVKLNQKLAQSAGQRSSLRETFRSLWHVYLQSISDSDLGKTWSLGRIGKLLLELAKQEKPTKSRSFTFKEGQPNLIQCDSDDMLVNILSVYEGANLPTAEEILLCNDKTTSEQICLIFKRALNDPHGRIFCLGGPETLDNRTSKEALRYFDSITKDKQASHYRLLVFHGHGNKKSSSPLLDAFNRYQVVQQPKQGLRPKIKQYLEQQLKPATGSLSRQSPVHVFSSTKQGTGKSLEVIDRAKKLQALMIDSDSPGIQLHDILLSLPIQGDEVDIRAVMSTIWNHMNTCHFAAKPHVFHLDISPSVRKGLDAFLFQLLVTKEITDSKGITWRRRPQDLYIVEATDLPIDPSGTISKNRRFFNLLPCSTCYTPKEVYWQLQADEQPRKPVAHPETFENSISFILESPEIVYVARHLWMLDSNMDMENYSYEADTASSTTPQKARAKALEIVEVLLKYCGCEDPSWRSLQLFAKFMTIQLRKCDSSGLYQDRTLKGVGFREFVVQFMTKMAREFTMPSFKLSDGNQEAERSYSSDPGPCYQMLRMWNNSSHAYIFFLKEVERPIAYYGCSFTADGSMIDPATNKVLESNMVSDRLVHGLSWNGTNFDGKDSVNLKELCKTIGVRYTHNPDDTFKLTPNNVKKLLAIHTRLRYGLPVVLMADRGCGKTRLIRYLCKLYAMDAQVKNLIHVKVHGGTTANDIMHCLTRAEIVQKLNRESNMVDTIMYIDEANTSEAFDLIKEIICDGRAKSHPIALAEGSLKIIVSCNPYRRYAPALIERLKSAGLGFNKFVLQRRQNQGPIPFGEMVYNVRPIPPSMLDFVWDYGGIGLRQDRDMCIIQVVIDRVESGKLQVNHEEAAAIGLIICTSQTYFMKKQHDECGLVTMKDVNRCLDVLTWFVDKMPAIEAAIQRYLKASNKGIATEQALTPITKAMILTLGVCYYARLHDSRKAFLEDISVYFKGACSFNGGGLRMEQEISRCQDTFMNELNLPPGIACNAALTENVFMMIICIELRIPLFLIGKPGTSKSLAKNIVADAMDGPTSGSGLLRTLKRAQFTTYQCNPNTTRKDINSVFEEASAAEIGNPDSYVSVVCLDEIGLAEGSKDTPLKILQPYLDRIPEDEEEEMYPPRTSCKNISFIAMSNWAVDVANMNTGIFIIIDDPDLEALIDTAMKLCPSTDISMMLGERTSLLPALAKAFLAVLVAQQTDYFGYPDFYNLIKMIIAFCQKSGQSPTMPEIEHCVRRNFDRCGSDLQWKIFRDQIMKHQVVLSDLTSEDPYCTDAGLIRASIEMSPNMQGETRHLLIETENYAAVSLLRDHLLRDVEPVLFFGSSFRHDKEYSQVCRTVNRIKRCMENGRTVILVNHSDLFESLHDVLNLHYTSFAGQNYVELALGTNRVKCRVHRDFRLIVVANRSVVNICFSAPLLGRFEKHYLAASTMLNEKEKFVANRLSSWLLEFASNVSGEKRSTLEVQDIIVGFHPDTIPSLVHREILHRPISGDGSETDGMFLNVQSSLVECATPAAKGYFRGATPVGYTSLDNFMWTRIQCSKLISDHGDLVQITTHSPILSDSQLTQLEQSLKLKPGCIQQIKDLEQYETERQFRAEVRRFFSAQRPAENLYQIFYCKDGHKKRDLIACACHFTQDEMSVARLKESKTHVIFLIQIPRGNTSFKGFLGGKWISAHIPSLTLSSPSVFDQGLSNKPPLLISAKPRPPGPPPVSRRPKPLLSGMSSPYGSFTQPGEDKTFM